jgi:endonuclease-8
VPEGDTIHYAANRIRPVLEGRVPDELRTPHRRFAHERWPERLAGRAVRRVEARGKNLLLRFEGGLVVRSHLRMTGAWRVMGAGDTSWPRSPRRAWLTIRRGDVLVVQFDGPVLELMTEGRTRFDQRLAGLGPDIVAADWDERRFLARLRDDDPTRPIGDALLDQSTVAGIGNVWKAEGCFMVGVDPWRRVADVSDDEALAIVRAVRPQMQRAAQDGMQSRYRTIYGAAGRPCPRCGTPIAQRPQGLDNRLTYWCPGCQT